MDVVSVCARLASIVDRLAHDSTDDMDALQTIAALRRVMKGEMPSRVLRIDAESRAVSIPKQVTDLRRKVAQMRVEKELLETEHHALQVEHTRVKRLYEDMQAAQARAAMSNADVQISYSYAEVMDIIRDKFGKHNGGFTLWAEYSAKLHVTDASSALLTTSKLQSWRTARAFPGWAVRQLLNMPMTTRTTHKWSEEDIEFLVRIHLADLHKTDEQLAAQCSERFGCVIGVNSIKSKFNILRKQGRIPMLRPEKPH